MAESVRLSPNSPQVVWALIFSQKVMKTNKSYAKRLKVTKSGKILVRRAGQNHFNAKESGRSQIKKGTKTVFHMSNKSRSRFLSGIK